MDDHTKEVLADLLIRWEELKDLGQDTPASELAKGHPELVDELSRRIRVLKATAWLDKPLDEDPTDNHGSEAEPILPRTLCDRYRLDELIAEGGFAQVFRAYDKELQRTVAVKIPKLSKLGSPGDFLAEARRVAQLKHASIVPVHDVGVEKQTCFIVSEYVEGGSLADRLVSGKVQQAQALRWVSEISEALQYAHAHGIVHRDVKPANILLDHHGRAKLADFGIAQSSMKAGEVAPSLGTLRYMAPEQLEGKATDHRGDIYSLAVVLYELLNGTVPYSSSEPNVLRKEIVNGLATFDRHLPMAIRAICRKALSKSPDQRHTSALMFATELRKVNLRSPGNWVTIAVVAVTLGIGAAGIAAVLANKGQSSQPPLAGIEVQKPDRSDQLLEAPKKRERIFIPMPARDRTFVNPETVGVGKDCPFPTVRDRICFQCPDCKVKIYTHVLYPHLPHCSKDLSVMLEVPPSADRQHWLGENDISFLYDKDLKRWKEQTGDAPPSSLFDESDNTAWYVEIYDPERKVTIRIYDGHAKYREDDGPWVLLRGGKWIPISKKE